MGLLKKKIINLLFGNNIEKFGTSPSDISQAYDLIKKLQWNSAEDLKKLQAEKLYDTMEYSIKNIPYYTNVAKRINFIYKKETIFEDILKWPTLTKEIIRNKFHDLYNEKYLLQSKLNYSGGTTGEPVGVYQQGSNVDLLDCFTRLQFEWAGVKPGDIIIQLWGSEEDLLKTGKEKTSGIIKISDSHYILNSFKMSEGDMERYRLFINEKKPALIVSYVQSIYELSQFIKTRKLFVYSPGAIMTSAGTLFDDQRMRIEEVFGCKVLNRYGSREVHNMACSCLKQEGLHVDTFFHYIEILDRDMCPVTSEGQIGEVYVTLFDNPVMPLVRYRIGDMATMRSEKCSCGRGLPLLKSIIGRTVDVFINEQGEKIDGEFFTHLFYGNDFVRQFQVIQKEKSKILIKYVPAKEVDDHRFLSSFESIVCDIKKVMGKSCEVIFERTEKIETSKSGKYRYTISEVTNI